MLRKSKVFGLTSHSLGWVVRVFVKAYERQHVMYAWVLIGKYLPYTGVPILNLQQQKSAEVPVTWKTRLPLWIRGKQDLRGLTRRRAKIT